MVTITIDTDNAAFSGDYRIELSRILEELAIKLRGGAGLPVNLRDNNGNTVGKIDVL